MLTYVRTNNYTTTPYNNYCNRVAMSIMPRNFAFRLQNLRTQLFVHAYVRAKLISPRTGSPRIISLICNLERIRRFKNIGTTYMCTSCCARFWIGSQYFKKEWDINSTCYRFWKYRTFHLFSVKHMGTYLNNES